MKRNKLVSMVAMMTALLLSAGSLCFAAANGPKKPGTSTLDAAGRSAPAKPASAELAAKREMVRKQQEQRVTQAQRKAGAKALQAERKKVYDAKQSVKNLQQPANDKK